jgi:hypothetical protein
LDGWVEDLALLLEAGMIDRGWYPLYCALVALPFAVFAAWCDRRRGS